MPNILTTVKHSSSPNLGKTTGRYRTKKFQPLKEAGYASYNPNYDYVKEKSKSNSTPSVSFHLVPCLDKQVTRKDIFVTGCPDRKDWEYDSETVAKQFFNLSQARRMQEQIPFTKYLPRYKQKNLQTLAKFEVEEMPVLDKVSFEDFLPNRMMISKKTPDRATQ